MSTRVAGACCSGRCGTRLILRGGIEVCHGQTCQGPSIDPRRGPVLATAGAPGPSRQRALPPRASSTAWKQTLHEDLRRDGLAPIRPGPVWLTVAISTGPGRVWTNLWKPLIDSLGPLLGEDPEQPFHPYDDRVVNLGLHHQRDPALGHDVVVHLWWGPAPPA